MSESTKPTENLAECGNKSKPLLQAVFFAPYLPYSVKIAYDYFGDTQEVATLIGVEDRNGETRLQINTGGSVLLKYCKLILKPLGDLTKDEKTCDEINEFLEPNGLEINNFLLLKNSLSVAAISWEEMQNVLNVLYREHYDVFGLINKRLAVSGYDVV